LTAWSLLSDLVFLLLLLSFRKTWSHDSSLELQQVTDPSVTLTFAVAAAARFVVFIVVVMLYELSVQDLALTHFASFSTVLNLFLYEALML
jgi:hypothetical protein